MIDLAVLAERVKADVPGVRTRGPLDLLGTRYLDVFGADGAETWMTIYDNGVAHLGYLKTSQDCRIGCAIAQALAAQLGGQDE